MNEDKNKPDNDMLKPVSWSYHANSGSEELPWGPHKLPVHLDLDGVRVTVEKEKSSWIYSRESEEEVVEKKFFPDKSKLFLSPVEPFNRPVRISTNLLIDFSMPVLVEPKAKRAILVTFPLEIAAFIAYRRSGESMIDVFSLSRQKYSLYGNIKDGLVCKHWVSNIYSEMPAVNPLVEGVMGLEVHNPTGQWVEVKKAVFNASGMKIYFDGWMVSLQAKMRIINERTAETSFLDKPLKTGMKSAHEQFGSRLFSQQKRIVMEEGL